MKLITIVGARPQLIKAAALSRVISREKKIDDILVHTGQHFDESMSQVFFDELELPRPKYNLNINNLPHGAMTGRMLEEIEKVLVKEKPDMVLVFGDTNSTLAGALAASKMHIRLAHVEAGMRSYSRISPEETNRILTDRISDLLFCSTDAAKANLEHEGFKNFICKIVQTGDVMLDTARYYMNAALKKSERGEKIPFKEFVLCTLHREENTNEEPHLSRIFSALNKINSEIPVVMPLHPRTRMAIKRLRLKSSINFVDPVGYLEMLSLLHHCSMVITDSGGLQKEAFYFSKFCITLRDQTEWTELVDLGVNRLTGSHNDRILSAFSFFSERKFSCKAKPYGNGHASEKIVSALLKYG